MNLAVRRNLPWASVAWVHIRNGAAKVTALVSTRSSPERRATDAATPIRSALGPLTTIHRVLLLCSTTELGGAEIVVRNLVKYFDPAVVEPIVATLGFGTGSLPAGLAALGVSIHRARPYRLRNVIGSLRNVLWLAHLIRREKVDAILTNGPHPHVYGALAAWVARRRSIWYVMMIPRRPLWRNSVIEQLALLLPTTHYIMASHACRDAFLRLFPARQGRVSIVHHGYDPDMLMPEVSGDAVRRELSVPPDAPVISIIGRLQRWKGQEYFIRAIPHVMSRFPAARFLVVGGSLFGLEPEYPDYLRGLARQLGVEHRVAFTGHRTDVAALIAASDVVVHGSIEPEPGANVVIEAMAMGKPVVATSIGCPPELLADTGIIVPAGDAEAIGAAVSSLLADEGRAAEFGRRAQARARQLFSARTMAAGVGRTIQACRQV